MDAGRGDLDYADAEFYYKLPTCTNIFRE